jgi:predicted nucleic acid-binding protein
MAILDTNFLIALKANEATAVELLGELEGEPLLVPSIVAAEYLTRFGADPVDAYQELDRAFTIVQTSPEWVKVAGHLRWSLQGKRRQVRRPDLWIGVWARLHRTFVVTRNEKDFGALGIEVRRW